MACLLRPRARSGEGGMMNTLVRVSESQDHEFDTRGARLLYSDPLVSLPSPPLPVMSAQDCL